MNRRSDVLHHQIDGRFVEEVFDRLAEGDFVAAGRMAHAMLVGLESAGFGSDDQVVQALQPIAAFKSLREVVQAAKARILVAYSEAAADAGVSTRNLPRSPSHGL